MNNAEDPMSDHQSLAGALPWYAASTLDDAERRRVEDHLASCAACREHLTQIRRFAELGARTSVDSALEHVAPGLLVDYAENRDGLEAETVLWIEGRLATCADCREAFSNLQAVGAALAPIADAEPRRSVLWDWLAATLLRPAPALAYLLIAAVGLPLLWFMRAPGDPFAAVQVVALSGERAQRDQPAGPGDPPGTTPITIRLVDAGRPLLVELVTDLVADDLRAGALGFVVELTTNGRPVKSERRDAAAFVLRDGRAVLPLMLDPRLLRLGQDYRVAIRVDKPGDPLDNQALFVRHLRFEEH